MTKIFVFDTNSLISANLLPLSVNRKAFDKAREIGISVHSTSTFNEFIEVFTRVKFDKYISIETRLKVIAEFEKSSQLISVSANVSVCRDPKDNKFLELAMETDAAYIITGDRDLLVLNPFEGIPVLTASDFVNIF